MGASDNYEFVRVLGRGGASIVELWRRRLLDQSLVVAKRIYLGEMSHAEECEARQEAQTLRRLEHPHITRYLGSWVHRETSDLIILQEFCEGGDLGRLVRKTRADQTTFEASQVLRWIAQLAHALQYCHKVLCILHRDLKPSNVFLSGNRRDAFVGDFGIAKALSSTRSLCNTFIGTEVYMSPEVLRMQSYGLKSDVWGLGTIVYEACTLRRPFDAKDPVSLVRAIVAPADPAPLPEQYSGDLQVLCSAMLTKDVGLRPTLGDLLAAQHTGALRSAVSDLEAEMAWQGETLLPQVTGAEQEQKREPTLPRVEEGQEEEAPKMSMSTSDSGQARRSGQSRPATDNDASGGASSLDPTRVARPLRPLSAAAAPVVAPRPDARPLSAAASATNSRSACEASRPATAAGRLPLSAFAADAAARLRHNSGAVGAAAASAVSDGWGQEPPPHVPPASAPPWLLSHRAGAQGTGTVNPPLPLGELGAELADAAVETAALQNAAGIHALLDLTLHRRDLHAIVECTAAALDAEADADASTENGADGNLEPPRASDGADPAPVHEALTSEADDQAARFAEEIGTRLRCLEALRSEEPDPVELTMTLQRVGALQLESEECAKALRAHAQRLCLRAEDEVVKEDAPLAVVERAADMLDATKAETEVPQAVLEVARQRVRRAQEAQQRVGLRSTCGPFSRLLSVRREAALAEVLADVARRWCRAPERLDLSWRDGQSILALRTEEQWRQCLRAHARGPIELVLAPAPTPKRQGSVHSAHLRRGRKTLAGLAQSSVRLAASKVLAGAGALGSSDKRGDAVISTSRPARGK